MYDVGARLPAVMCDVSARFAAVTSGQGSVGDGAAAVSDADGEVRCQPLLQKPCSRRRGEPAEFFGAAVYALVALGGPALFIYSPSTARRGTSEQV